MKTIMLLVTITFTNFVLPAWAADPVALGDFIEVHHVIS